MSQSPLLKAIREYNKKVMNMGKEDKIEEKRFKILTHDAQINQDFVCIVKAKSVHHAFNLIYSKTGLTPIREATAEDYAIVAEAMNHAPTFTIREGLPATTIVIAKE